MPAFQAACLDVSPVVSKMTEGSSPLFGAPCRRVDCVEEHMSLIDKAKHDPHPRTQ
jgi:hypothetical protein